MGRSASVFGWHYNYVIIIMPINILPEGEPDWIEFNLQPNILFMAVDPWWKIKTGIDPDNARVYRGGAGFFERSDDGGKTWASILPGTPPPWFPAGREVWNQSYSEREPVPRPATAAPSYDNYVTAPTAAQLTYHSYSGSAARTDEHVVLATYTLDDAAGELNGTPGDFTNELSVSWLLYTFDDWVTHEWNQLLMNTWQGDSIPSEGSETAVHSETRGSLFEAAIRTGNNLFAVFNLRNNGILDPDELYCHMISESGGTFSVDGSASDVADRWNHVFAGSDLTLWEYQGHVYMAGHTTVAPVADDDFYDVSEWDCSGSTPSLVGTTRLLLPTFYPPDATFQSGQSFYMTPSGRLAFTLKVDGGGQIDWYWFYYDSNTTAFSTLHRFWSGTSSQVPNQIDITAQAIDGSNKCAIAMLEQWGADDYFGYTFIMTIGDWTQIGKEQYLEDLGATSPHGIGKQNSKLWDGGRWAFVPQINGNGGFFRVYTYDAVMNTLTYIPNVPDIYTQSDVINRGGFCLPQEPVSNIGFCGNNMHWVDKDVFPSGSVEISNPDRTGVVAGFGDLSRYVRLFTEFEDPNFIIKCSVVTVPPKPPDDMFSRFGHESSVSYTPDGNNVFVILPTFDGVAEDDMVHYADNLEREPAHLGTGKIGYQTDFGTGWFWLAYDNFTKVQLNNLLTFAGVNPWWDEGVDGILVFGLLDGVSSPTQPGQIEGWSTAQGIFDIWSVSLFTDPCRAVIDISSRIYAVAEATTVIKLYEAKAVLVDDGANMIYVSDSILDTANYGRIMDVDNIDDTIVVAGGAADLIMVVGASPPWTTWNNITLSHRNDRGVTSLVIMD